MPDLPNLAKILPQPISWADFKARCERLARMAMSDRSGFLFRGQSSPEWRLIPTLDRGRSFATDQERSEFRKRLLQAFWRESVGLHRIQVSDPLSTPAEAMARHHGLPTQLLDWTRSPYIAAFFAYDGLSKAGTHPVSVWALHQDAFLDNPVPDIQIVSDEGPGLVNLRSIEQRSVYLQLISNKQFVDGLIPSRLQRIDLGGNDRALALRDLDNMGINARSLFRSLEGAASVVLRRFEEIGEVQRV